MSCLKLTQFASDLLLPATAATGASGGGGGFVEFELHYP